MITRFLSATPSFVKGNAFTPFQDILAIIPIHTDDEVAEWLIEDTHEDLE